MPNQNTAVTTQDQLFSAVFCVDTIGSFKKDQDRGRIGVKFTIRDEAARGGFIYPMNSRWFLETSYTDGRDTHVSDFASAEDILKGWAAIRRAETLRTAD